MKTTTICPVCKAKHTLDARKIPDREGMTSQDEIDMYGSFWEELKNLGADDIIHKSINMEEKLLTKIESLLKGESLLKNL